MTPVWLLQLYLPNSTGSGDRWFEAVRSIEFSHSSQKAWSILNNLTGRSRYFPRCCPVSADAIASQLFRNGRYESLDLWRAITPDPVNMSENFSQNLLLPSNTQKSGKASGADSICPEPMMINLMKSVGDPKSYRPMPLLCVPCLPNRHLVRMIMEIV